MSRFFLIPAILLTIFSCGTLQEHAETQQNDPPVIEQFPEDWLGQYTGTLEVYRPGITKSLYSADVSMTIAATEDSTRWQWTTIYTSEGREPIEKKYFLIQPDSLPVNQFLLDEDNGIFINQYLFGNTFTSAYTVNDQFFTVTVKKEKNTLEQEISVYSSKPYGAVEMEEGFEVGKIDLLTIQKIRFKKAE